MREPKYSTRFRKDLKRQKKRGKLRHKFEYVMAAICESGDAPEGCKPHDLSGNWKGYRECHIEPDWLLVYVVSEDSVLFHRTGSHSDLFR